jgi:hypothetical protein
MMPTSTPTINKGRKGKLAQELERFRQDTAWFETHREELLEQYPEQWVFIYNQRVAAASPDARTLFAEAKEKGVPAGRGFPAHLTRTVEDLILHL